MGAEGNICPNCGKLNAERNKFCSGCGTLLEGTREIVEGKDARATSVECRACGFRNKPGARRCQSCQAPFAEGYLVSEHRSHAHVAIEFSELDYENHDTFRQIIKRINRSKIAVDMSQITYMDSVGIGTIVSVTNPMYGMGKEKEFHFYGVSSEVMNALQGMSVDKVLDIFPSRESAVQDWDARLQKA